MCYELFCSSISQLFHHQSVCVGVIDGFHVVFRINVGNVVTQRHSNSQIDKLLYAQIEYSIVDGYTYLYILNVRWRMQVQYYVYFSTPVRGTNSQSMSSTRCIHGLAFHRISWWLGWGNETGPVLRVHMYANELISKQEPWTFDYPRIQF